MARARPFHRWDQVAEASALSADQAIWFAERSGETAGMISAYATANGLVTLTSLWAAPGHRGVGVAEVLVAEATRWATGLVARQLRLWVVERNEHARRFYERLGFVPTGAEITYEPDPRVKEVELRLDLERRSAPR